MKRGPSRDQSVLTRTYPSIRCRSTGRVCAGDSRCIEEYVRTVHCSAESGLGREGVKFAMEEMTNIQMVAIKLN